MNNFKPVVIVAGQLIPLPDGNTIDYQHLPDFRFEQDDYKVASSLDVDGKPVILFSLSSGEGAETNVRIPRYSKQRVFKRGVICYDANTLAFYVALNNGTLTDPAEDGEDWSIAFSDYSLAIIYITKESFNG